MGVQAQLSTNPLIHQSTNPLIHQSTPAGLCKNGCRDSKKGLVIDNSAVAVFSLIAQAVLVIIGYYSILLVMKSSRERHGSRREFLRAGARGGGDLRLPSLLLRHNRDGAQDGIHQAATGGERYIRCP